MLLLSPTFGGQGLGCRASASRQERRIEVPELRVRLVPAQGQAAEPAGTPVAEPLQPAPVVKQPVAAGAALTQPGLCTAH